MGISSIGEIEGYLRANKEFLRDKFGVTRMGIFGSFGSILNFGISYCMLWHLRYCLYADAMFCL